MIQGWLNLGDVGVTFTWDQAPHFDLGHGSLFGAVGLQLALAVARREGLSICDECGVFFVPQRQNRPGVPRRCNKPECRQRAAKRESARRRRAVDRALADGSIYQRASDGRWVGVVQVKKAGGANGRKYLYAGTQAEAIEKVKAFETDKEPGQ